MAGAERSKTAGLKRFQASACVVAAFLQKFAKHLGLIACLTIMGGATGRFATSEVAIFLMIVAAAALHSIGRVLEYRLPPPRLPGLGP
jgi:hypothetical protein